MSSDDTYTTVAFGTRPKSWYRSQGLSMNQPSGSATKDKSVTTDGTYKWDSTGKIIAGPKDDISWQGQNIDVIESLE